MFATMRPAAATAYAFALGWCFLPVAGYPLPGVPDYTKSTATMIGVLFGIGIFHFRLFSNYRPSLLDLFPLAFCACPFASSVTNGLGAYDGLSAVVNQTVTWGIPYGLGRIAFRTPRDLTDFLNTIIVCGLIYVPFCLWEVRMSPQLHRQFYGFSQHSFAQTIRGGGWRPMVFMNHGLQVALWMVSSLIAAISIGWVGNRKRFGKLPIWAVVAFLGFTFVLLKSTGAFVLLLVAVGFIGVVKFSPRPYICLIPLLLVTSFLTLRISELITGRSFVTFAESYLGEERAGSLRFRLDNEDVLLAKAKEQWLFGWAGWGRSRVYDDEGRDLTVTDGLWIIELGTHGVVGLASLFGVFLAGSVAAGSLSRQKLSKLDPMTAAAVVGFVAITGVSAIDSIPNAMVIPIFVVASGALITVVSRLKSNRPESFPPQKGTRGGEWDLLPVSRNLEPSTKNQELRTKNL